MGQYFEKLLPEATHVRRKLKCADWKLNWVAQRRPSKVTRSQRASISFFLASLGISASLHNCINLTVLFVVGRVRTENR